MYFCPKVSDNCCSIKSEKQIYDNWIVAGEKNGVYDHIHFYLKIYKKVLELSDQIFDRASLLEETYRHKSPTSCYIMANKLSRFDIKGFKLKMDEAWKKIYDFQVNTYEGIYCGLCNANNHEFIDLQKNVLYISENYCRRFLQENLQYLIYFHSELLAYLNLGEYFIKSCTHENKFDLEEFPENYAFVPDSHEIKRLDRCFKYQNTLNWLYYCKKVCEKVTF